ncbi:MAG: sugar phosphate isomerase/epimerase family protein [Anaerovoracaceae bacterium]
MEDRICIATFSENAVSVIRRHGVGIELNDLCISENLDPERLQTTMDAIREEIRRAGVKPQQIIAHGPFTEICPASIDHRAVELGRRRLDEAWSILQSLGICRMVVHTGYIPLIYYPQWQLEKSIVFWKDFLMEKPSDFRLYIENVFEDTPEQQLQLIRGLDDPRVSACLDVGHAHAVTRPEYPVCRWIEEMGSCIGHFHLHNNDGKKDLHNPLTEGTMDMEAVLRAIGTYCRPDVTMTIESRVCEGSVQWILQQDRLLNPGIFR